MEAVMRNGVVGGLLCLVGLQSQVNCQVNWKNSKVSYLVTSSISDFQWILVLQKRSIRRIVITEKALTRDFSWLKAATTTFTFKTLLRHYAKWALTPQSLNVKLGPRRKSHKGRAVWLA